MSFRAFFLSLTIVSMLLFSAFGTTTAYADDGIPPESTESVTVTAQGEGEEEPVAEETPQPGEEETPVTETSQPEEGVTPEATPQPGEGEVTVTETPETEESVPTAVAQPLTKKKKSKKNPLLNGLPKGTTLTVVNSNGEVEPLGSQNSAEIVASGSDPIWCPEGQSPTPGENGCTESFGSMEELLSFLEANENNPTYQQAGTIYIEEGAYTGPETSINLNNYNFNSLNNFNLTFQGGWNTSNNTVTGTTQVNVPVSVGSSTNPWVGSVTFNNIWINGVSGGTALTVYTESNIELSNVEASNSNLGANLNATGSVTVKNSNFNNNKNGGAVINAGGVVNVENSQFNNNKSKKSNGGGLEVHGGSEVSLLEVTANENGLFGANIVATGVISVDRSVFSGNVSYAYNCKGGKATGGYGIQAVSAAEVYVDGVTAENNFSFGAHLEGANVEVYNGVFSNNGLAGSKYVNSLAGKGLEIVSAGYVILDNVIMNNNTNFGLNIEAGEFVTVENSSANENGYYGANIATTSTVTINNSFFNGNKSYTSSCKGKTYNGYGLQVVASEGIYITNVSASENNLFGSSLNGGVVYINGGFFNNNGSAAGNTGSGIEINSATFVTISEIEANNNQLFGANIVSVDDVTISEGFFNGNKSYTYSCKGKTASGSGYGLQVVTGGDITLTEITASENYEFGASLSGASLALATGFFNNNGSGSLENPTGKGLEVEVTGNVDLVEVEANGNQLFGANIQAGGNVSITGGFFNGNKGYTYSCKSKTYQGYGLQVVAGEDVSLINIEANENYLYGAHLEGQNVFVSYGVFSNNGTGNPSEQIGKGLEIVSTGSNNTVSLYQVTANNNQEFGANIKAEGFVSVSDSTFSGNVSYTSNYCKGNTYNGYGIQVVTTNGVNIFNVTASENGQYGASLEGDLVEVYNSTFENNITSNGLTINANEVIVDNTVASGNGANGAKICANVVTVTNSTFENNEQYGLNVGSPVLTESGNIYTNNGSGSLFHSPDCTTTSGGGNNGGNGWGWGHGSGGKNHGKWGWGWGSHNWGKNNYSWGWCGKWGYGHF